MQQVIAITAQTFAGEQLNILLATLQVQTNGECEPKTAVQDALKDLQAEFTEIGIAFTVRNLLMLLVAACTTFSRDLLSLSCAGQSVAGYTFDSHLLLVALHLQLLCKLCLI